ncbi:MAG: hypothetical protein A2751_05845 [Candidatus Doudnabacteria bacterium RIFCSPHIGHO2_01_FULL_46_14]|uniref:DUF5343 domain-containing protein n=1 Tax=Candidatus Doudnabacteria bacterium RIFCSPHIGHO2_01_FULL_46_14 TaxID=1817824 RepID=A0A1F5NN73_9BACT|nr:MAG: hypothetical protein A2751_05845 [Candidatus Doudnabacteria bacterium RIFCSPHIGHO2_01_FULL_46_14]
MTDQEDTKTENPRQMKPPYFSVAKLDKTIELISTRNYAEINQSIFTGYGFGDTDALLAVNALRFLGLIDEQGKPTELFQKVRLKGDVRKKEFEKIVRAAYHKLFSVVEAPQDLSPDDLNNEFIAQYGLSGRLVRTAIPVFNRLLEYAGLKEEGSVVSRIRQPRAEKKARTESSTKTPNVIHNQPHTPSGLFPIKIVDGKFTLLVPPDFQSDTNFDDELSAKYRQALKDLKAVAEDYLSKKSPRPPDTTDA